MKKPKEFFGEYRIRPFHADLIIACLNDSKDLYKHLNKKKNKHLSDWLKKFIDKIPNPNGVGGMIYDPETSKPLILFIQNKKRDWEFYGTLMHEINHVIYHLSRNLGFQDEPEFQAYLAESLFTDIRRLLF
jgi:Zn-dependent peptidase ImmA (M78 family)